MQENENCTHDCSSCRTECASREKKESLVFPMNTLSEIKNVIAVVSGKGGVGKSIVTSMLAVEMQRRGHKVAILDADITGPSIPKAFGLSGAVQGCEEGMYPLQSKTGIRVMSVNLLLEGEDRPVIWRGPVIAGIIKQFWKDVVWGDVDYMFIDMPPGTGDVPLTVFQSLPVNGAVVVTGPQELASMVVGKSVNMARMMNIPILGLVENMAYALCPDCGRRIDVFGQGGAEKTASKYDMRILAEIPLDGRLSALCDKGIIELFDNEYLSGAADIIEKQLTAASEE